jgi:hypothetical protein
MMHYCALHQRALIPAGYDTRHRVSQPARWHPLPPAVLALAWAYAAAWGCAGEIVMEAVACDRCGDEAAREMVEQRRRG